MKRRSLSLVTLTCLLGLPMSAEDSAHAQFSTVINIPGDPVPGAVGADTQVNLLVGGTLGQDVELGSAGTTTDNSELNVLGGRMGSIRVYAYNGSRVNVTDGEIAGYLYIEEGAEGSFSGGDFYLGKPGGTGHAAIRSGGAVVVSGGLFAPLTGLQWDPGADLTFVGDQFWLNADPVTFAPDGTTSVTVAGGDLISGRLADGRAFGFRRHFSEEAAAIQLQRSKEPISVPEFVDLPGDEVIQVTAGQTLRFEASPFHEIPGRIYAYPQSNVEISGSEWVSALNAFNSNIHMSSGKLAGVHLNLGSELLISGGTVDSVIYVLQNSRLIVTGGRHRSPEWTSFAGSAPVKGGEVVIVGSGFSLLHPDPEINEAIDSLTRPGDSIVIDRREELDDGQGGTLPLTVEATLVDGQPVAWELSRTFEDGRGVLVTPAKGLTARFTVGFPEGFCDFNASGDCEPGDIELLHSQFGSGNRHFDLNYDGVVDERDEQQLLLNASPAIADTLTQAIVAGSEESRFDLNQDGMVDRADLTRWVEDINGTSFGDANLDGSVDAGDLNILALNWRRDVALWSAGDFNADGSVDAGDLNELALNWRQPIPLGASVPEPSSLLLTVVALTLICQRRKHR